MCWKACVYVVSDAVRVVEVARRARVSPQCCRKKRHDPKLFDPTRNKVESWGGVLSSMAAARPRADADVDPLKAHLAETKMVAQRGMQIGEPPRKPSVTAQSIAEHRAKVLADAAHDMKVCA